MYRSMVGEDVTTDYRMQLLSESKNLVLNNRQDVDDEITRFKEIQTIVGFHRLSLSCRRMKSFLKPLSQGFSVFR